MTMSDHHLDRMSPIPWRTLSASSTPQPHHNHLLHLHHQGPPFSTWNLSNSFIQIRRKWAGSRHSPSSFHGSTILTGPGPPLGIPPPPASISNGQNGIGIRHLHRDDDDTSSTVSRGSRLGQFIADEFREKNSIVLKLNEIELKLKEKKIKKKIKYLIDLKLIYLNLIDLKLIDLNLIDLNLIDLKLIELKVIELNFIINWIKMNRF